MNRKVKRFLFFIILISCSLMLSACSMSDLTIPRRWKNKTTEYKEDIPAESYERSKLDNIMAYSDAYSFKDVHKMIYGRDGYMPSKGDVKVLVLPISFSDVYTSSSNLVKYRTDIERAFFGTDTGYESLKTYYEKSSYGNLKISGTVLPWYTPKNSSTYYENIYTNSYDKISSYLGELANEILSYYSSEIDFSDYDYDKDGIIDGVYLICNKNLQKYDSLYWSWVTYYNGKKTQGDYKLYQFMWSNIGFLYHDDFYKPVKNNTINAITLIHETGHLMGCDDYYDYSANEYSSSIFGSSIKEQGKGCNIGAGSYDMMDGNVGDHCANTKMLFGWITPYVITKDITIDLNKFSKNGDAIIVAPSFDTDSGNLSEYFVIEYYDHEGLADQNIFDNRGYRKSGIRIYHINSKVERDSSYWSLFKYDNSYTSHAFMGLIDASSNLSGKGDFIDSSLTATDSSLFQKGDTFIPTASKEYVNKLLLNVEVSINDVNDDTASITIRFKD